MLCCSPRTRFGGAGAILTLLLVIGLVALGIALLGSPSTPEATAATQETSAPRQDLGEAPQPIEPAQGLPQLAPAGTYVPKDGVLAVDISEYAGYAGLIAANGGLKTQPGSIYDQLGLQIQLSLSEGENWSALGNGQFAASATTVDVLPVLGRNFNAVTAAQISFSRGADMVIVDRGISGINGLAGKVLATSQHNEAEFFLRYLAQEAGVPVRVLRDLDARPSAKELGLVFYEDAFVACDAYAYELASGNPRLNGAVGWSPRTDEVVAESAGAAKVLVSNRNLLIVADILCLNRGWAEAEPQQAQLLVQGLLQGNAAVRDNPQQYASTIASSLQWEASEVLDELKKLHLSNLPESLAFFRGTIDAAGSFGGIYQSAVLAYGSLIKNPAEASRLLHLAALDALEASGFQADARMGIAPIKTGSGGSLEGDPLLSKDIRFFFEPNSAKLDNAAQENLGYLDTVQRFLQVSPGSVVLLRGHVDPGRVEEFRKQGPEFLRSMTLKAMQLSQERAQAVREALLQRHKQIDPARVEAVGRGWEEPASQTDQDINRRVEVQWFTLE